MYKRQLNGFRNTEFQRRDLYEESLNSWCPGSFNKLIIDPPRSGAQEVAMGLVPRVRPQRIVYVSCNPATLARDSAILISNNKYRLQSLRVIDMFPHTTHVEVLAVFESGKREKPLDDPPLEAGHQEVLKSHQPAVPVLLCGLS